MDLFLRYGAREERDSRDGGHVELIERSALLVADQDAEEAIDIARVHVGVTETGG